MDTQKLMENRKQKERNSSIELLKVIGIVLVVISHVVQTADEYNAYITDQNYILNLSAATRNVQHLALSMLRYSGQLGNIIFLVCSCWFLVDSQKANKKKMLQMLLEIWTVSVLILGITYILRNGDISKRIIIKSIFPTLFANNWYMTCYLLFYGAHPFLNKIVNQVPQRTMLRCTLLLTVLYICCNYVIGGLFFTSSIILWVAIYFLIAYIKLYLKNTSNNVKINIAVLLFGVVGNYGLILFTNILGLHLPSFQNQLQRWNSNGSPFMILMAIGLLNIARNICFRNTIINYISKLSLLIYITHENLILRTYYRPGIWKYVYTNFGYDHILEWTFILVVAVFAFGFLASVAYQNTIQKLVVRVSDVLYFKLTKYYGCFENWLLQIH